jgi:hypothetical protein
MDVAKKSPKAKKKSPKAKKSPKDDSDGLRPALSQLNVTKLIPPLIFVSLVPYDQRSDCAIPGSIHFLMFAAGSTKRSTLKLDWFVRTSASVPNGFGIDNAEAVLLAWPAENGYCVWKIV